MVPGEIPVVEDSSSEKERILPRLGFWQIWNMSFGFLGIQFGFALQNANVSRIFETLGAEKDALPILWLAAPVTGLLVQPIVGYFSDKTWIPRLGRRSAFLYAGRNFGIHRFDFYAQFSQSLDSCGHALDYGCFDQYFHGAIQGLCGGYAPFGSENDRVCRTEFFHWDWSCGSLHASLYDDKLVRRFQYRRGWCHS